MKDVQKHQGQGDHLAVDGHPRQHQQIQGQEDPLERGLDQQLLQKVPPRKQHLRNQGLDPRGNAQENHQFSRPLWV